MPPYDWAKMSVRERDALVAEHVMGLNLVDDYPEQYWSQLTSMPLTIPLYTTELSYAWQVAEKMHQENFFVETSTSRYTCFVEIQSDWEQAKSDEDARVSFIEVGENVAECICKCSLRAKGVDV